MNRVDRQMRLAALEAAVLLPWIAGGESLALPVIAIRPRLDGNYRAYADGKYIGTTGCATLAEAEQWRDTLIRQFEAEAEGIFDVRRLPVSAAIEQRKQSVTKRKLKGAKVIVSTLEAIAKHMEDLRLHHLTNEKMEEIGKAMVAKGYAHEYYVNGARFLATAIRQYTRKKNGGVAWLPYDPPASPKGRKKVVSKTERDRVKARYEAALNPESGMSETERRDAEVAYMELYLGLTFGSRPGAYANLAWEQHDEGGWLDLDGAVFYRVPPGAETPGNKRADPVDIPPEVIPELRCWKERARGNKWVFRTLKGGPLGQAQQQKIFKAQMLKLGLKKVTGHVLRHSFITWALMAGVAPAAVAAVASVSLEMMLRRYAHIIRRPLQKLAHGVMATMMTAA